MRELQPVLNSTDCVQTIRRERLTGRTGTLQAETRAIDAHNQTSTVKTLVDRGNKTVTVETTVPGSSTIAKQITKNGFLAQTISAEGVTTNFEYDVYGRPTKGRGREDVLEEKTYYPKSVLVKNLRNKYMTPSVIGSEWQEFQYDSAGRMVIHSTNNVGQWKTARYAYNAMGQRTHEWGDAANPTEFVYDSYGRRTQMKLYRNGSGWNAASWPTGTAGTPDTTTWSYHQPTGLVTSKTDAATRTVSFTYNVRNQVATRTWARNTVTTYSYFDQSGYRTGELRRKDYSDGTTPAVEYFPTGWNGQYSRTGQARRIQDATGWTEFFYHTNDAQLKAERLDWTFYGSGANGGREVYRSYDSVGRPSYVQMGWEDSAHSGNAPTGVENEMVYGYDSATGRVSSIIGHRPNYFWRKFLYSYQGNSNLVSAVYGDGFGFRRENQWQAWRNIVDYVRTYWSGTTKANFHYDYDWVEQRHGEDHNDDLATTLGYGGGVDTDYLFSPRRELEWVNATRMSGGAQIADRYRDWTYDNAANRTAELYSGGSRGYTPNNLNQYEAVAGVTYIYDNDGNLTNDGVWWYSYDGENRLSVAQKQDGTKRLEFTYDYLGRRVRKIVRNGGAGSTIVSDRRFIYDGWNTIAEIDGGNGLSVVRTFTWGLDLTGTVHGGGGVGGLLMIAENGVHLMPIYDANGNVRGLLDGNNGNMLAAYGYSAFGEVIQAVNPLGGSYAQNNPIRFASKWYDEETKLYQYNHRYYSPALGRFISRDPIEEDGGLNLYGYCGGDPIGKWDYLGMTEGDGIPLDGPGRWYYEEFVVAAQHSQMPVYANAGFAGLREQADASARSWDSGVASNFWAVVQSDIEREARIADGRAYAEDSMAFWSQRAEVEVGEFQSLGDAPNSAGLINPNAGRNPDPRYGPNSTTAGGPPVQVASFGTAVGGLIDDHIAFTAVVGVTGSGGGFIPAGPAGQVTPVAFGVSFNGDNGFQFGYLPGGAVTLQVMPTYTGSVFLEVTNAGSLDSLMGRGYIIGGSGGEGLSLGVDFVTGWVNDAPGGYQGLQLSLGLGGGFPVEGHAGTTYTTGTTTGGTRKP